MTTTPTRSTPQSRVGPQRLSFEEAASALQVVPFGGADDGSLGLAITPALRAAVSPIVTALRWSTAMFGVLYAAPKAQQGDLAVVVSTTVCLFLASWRTVRPLKLDSPRTSQRVLATTDALIVGAATGVSGGLLSPYAFCLGAVALIAAFGWGLRVGLASLVGALVALVVAAELTNADTEYLSQTAVELALLLAVGTVAAALLRRRLLSSERRRLQLTGRLDQLAETNDLLQILNRMARTLPTALDGREAVESIRSQLDATFGPSALLVLGRTEPGDTWIPRVVDGMTAKLATTDQDLPAVLVRAQSAGTTIRMSGEPGDGVAPDARCGLYAPLKTRGRTVGLIAIEHRVADRYGARDERILQGLTEVIALTLDNARWFGRLRTLGAEEERSRIARDLHDRVGQWLTYIGFELERISATDPDPQLVALHADVRRAIDELRDTLRQLRMTVTESLPFSQAAQQLLNEFATRTGLEVEFIASDPSAAMAVPVENELLRILQEGLHNVHKHARASTVRVHYDIGQRAANLTLSDDGNGFEPDRGVRDNAYGLIGMRERADVIGATFTLTSSPNGGTTISIDVPKEPSR